MTESEEEVERLRAERDRYAEAHAAELLRVEQAERWAKKYDAQRLQAEQELRAIYATSRRALTDMGVDPDESPERTAVLDGMGAGLDVSCTCGIGGSELDGPYPHAAHCGLEPPDAHRVPSPMCDAEVPTRAEVWQALRDELQGRLSRLREGAPSTYVTDVAAETAMDTLIECGWLRVRDEGGQE